MGATSIAKPVLSSGNAFESEPNNKHNGPMAAATAATETSSFCQRGSIA